LIWGQENRKRNTAYVFGYGFALGSVITGVIGRMTGMESIGMVLGGLLLVVLGFSQFRDGKREHRHVRRLR